MTQSGPYKFELTPSYVYYNKGPNYTKGSTERKLKVLLRNTLRSWSYKTASVIVQNLQYYLLLPWSVFRFVKTGAIRGTSCESTFFLVTTISLYEGLP